VEKRHTYKSSTHTHILSLSLTHTHTHSHTHTLSLSLSHTHTHPYIHTYTGSLSIFRLSASLSLTVSLSLCVCFFLCLDLDPLFFSQTASPPLYQVPSLFFFLCEFRKKCGTEAASQSSANVKSCSLCRALQTEESYKSASILHEKLGKIMHNCRYFWCPNLLCVLNYFNALLDGNASQPVDEKLILRIPLLGLQLSKQRLSPSIRASSLH